MLRYSLRRIGQMIPLALLVATAVFSLIHLIPGDPVAMMLGEGARPGDVRVMRERLGLDDPLPVQYLEFLKGLVTGDLGQSFHYQRPVTGLILEHYPATLELAAGSLLVALVVAIPLGILAAVYRDRWLDHTARVVSLAGVSMPNFWLGPILILLFSIHMGWFPVSGRGSLGHLVLPSITLGTALAGLLARMVRTAVADELPKPYMVTARAKGVTRQVAVWRHAFSNALIPIVTIIGLQTGVLLTGAIITETIFSWPGLGRLLIQAIRQRDYPVVQGGVLLMAFTYLLVNLVTDLVYARLDPRIRLGSESS